MVAAKSSKFQYPDLNQTRITKDEEDVSSIVSVLEDSVNPFQGPVDLLNLSNDTLAKESVSTDLARAHDIGETTYAEFKEQRLETDVPEPKYYTETETENVLIESQENCGKWKGGYSQSNVPFIQKHATLGPNTTTRYEGSATVSPWPFPSGTLHSIWDA